MVTEILIGVAGVVGVSAYMGVGGYNRVVTLARRCEQATADVDVQVRHRHDLIPNLVQTVRGFADHERGMFDTLMSARAQAMQAASPNAQAEAESLLSIRLNQVVAAVETYPEVRSSPHFTELRRELSDVENKIAAARRFQNMAVSEYNASIDQFPMNLIAQRAGLNARRSYDLGMERVFVEEAPVVKF